MKTHPIILNVHYRTYRKLHAFKKEKLAQLHKEHKLILNYIVEGKTDRIDAIVYPHIRVDINSPFLQKNYLDYIKNNIYIM